MNEREQPLSDHPFCQQEQEPDQIDMMSAAELRKELRALLTEGRRKDLLLEAYEEACSDDINERVKECVEKYLNGISQ